MISRLVSRCRPGDRESGQASMVTVAMFMMLFSVITVGFTYVMISASRQAVNDSLQSSAKAAAESGVEDAKRLIVYCYNHRNNDGTYTSPQDANLCKSIIGKRADQLEGTDCDDILRAVDSSPQKVNFGLESVKNNEHRVKVGNGGAGKNSSNEYYQCLKIATRTDNYEGIVSNLGKSTVIPLRLVDGNGNPATRITEIKIQWHRNVDGADGDGVANLNNTNGTGLPPVGVWKNNSYNRPAVLRVERVGAKKGGFSINDLVASDTAVTLRPSTGGSKSVIMDYYHPLYNDRPNYQYPNGVPIIETQCNSGGGTGNNNYACTMSATDILDAKNNDYYLRLSAIYKDSHFSIRAYDDGKILYFDGVQPLVDVTGSSSDSFSRIQARLKPSFDKNADSTNWWPEYVIDTNGKVCKDIEVQYDEGEDRCKYK